MRRLVYLSRCLSEKEKPQVEHILSTFDENIEYTSNPASSGLSLRVINTSAEFGSRMNAVCLSVSLSCLRDMRRKNISPFEFHCGSNVLKNLSLLNKRLFLLLREKRYEKRLQMLIGAMAGTVTDKDSDADYVITDDGRMTQNAKGNIVHASWIDALMRSFKQPANFMVPLSLSTQPGSQRLALTQEPRRSVKSLGNNSITKAFLASPHVNKKKREEFELEVSDLSSSQSAKPSQDESKIVELSSQEDSVEVKTQPEKRSPTVRSPPDLSPSQGSAYSPHLSRLCERIMRSTPRPTKPSVMTLTLDDLTMFSQSTRDDDDRSKFDIKYDLTPQTSIEAKGDRDPLLDFLAKAQCNL